MGTVFIGMDVSKDDFKAAGKDETNTLVMPARTYRHDQPGLTEFMADVRKVREQLGSSAVFGMEATGIYHLSAYQHLLEAGARVKVFNALELKRFKNRLRKTKTDALDAMAIAEALILSREPNYHPTAEPELVRLRELCRLRSRLVEKRGVCKKQVIRDMDVLCRGYSDMSRDILSPNSIAVLKAVVRSTRLFKIGTDELAAVLKDYMPEKAAAEKAGKLTELFHNAVIPEHMRESCILEIHMLVQQYELLAQQINRVERRIESIVAEANPRMLTTPGLGILTVGIILGELGDLNRFRSARQLTAFTGLDPSIMESGRSRRTGHISKRGSRMLREALYNAALAASRVNPVCRALYQRLRKNGKHHKVCMVAVARKLLHIAYSVETKQKDFYVPSYIATAQVEDEKSATEAA